MTEWYWRKGRAIREKARYVMLEAAAPVSHDPATRLLVAAAWTSRPTDNATKYQDFVPISGLSGDEN